MKIIAISELLKVAPKRMGFIYIDTYFCSLALWVRLAG